MPEYSLHVYAEGPGAPALGKCVAVGTAPTVDDFWRDVAPQVETHEWRLKYDALRVEVRPRGKTVPVLSSTFYPEEPVAQSTRHEVTPGPEPDFLSIAAGDGELARKLRERFAARAGEAEGTRRDLEEAISPRTFEAYVREHAEAIAAGNAAHAALGLPGTWYGAPLADIFRPFTARGIAVDCDINGQWLSVIARAYDGTAVSRSWNGPIPQEHVQSMLQQLMAVVLGVSTPP